MDIFVYQEVQGRLDRLHHVQPVKRGNQEQSIEQRFQRFHLDNPQVAHELAKLALDLKRAGVQRFGIKALFGTLRYQRALKTAGEPWKLNNGFAAHYARMLMLAWPELEGFFELRRSGADV